MEQLERLKELLSYKVDLPHAVEGEAVPPVGPGKDGRPTLEGRRTINKAEADRLFLEAVEEFVSILEKHGMEELRAREKDAREEYADCTQEEEEARERIKEIVRQEDYSEEKARFIIGAASVGLPFASPQDPVQVELARQAGIIRHRQRSRAEIAHRLSVLLNVRRLYQRRGAKGLEELRQLLADFHAPVFSTEKLRQHGETVVEKVNDHWGSINKMKDLKAYAGETPVKKAQEALRKAGIPYEHGNPEAFVQVLQEALEKDARHSG